MCVGTAASAGCYAYVPTEPGIPPRGAVVRAEVRDRLTLDVGGRAVHDVARVEGEVVAWRPDTLALSASSLRAVGREVAGGGYTVLLPLADVASLTVRRSDVRRSVLLALVAAAAAVALGSPFDGGPAGDGGGGGGAAH